MDYGLKCKSTASEVEPTRQGGPHTEPGRTQANGSATDVNVNSQTGNGNITKGKAVNQGQVSGLLTQYTRESFYN